MSYKELADYLDGLATGEFGTTHPKLANAAAILRSLDAQPVAWQYREANDDGTWGAWLGCDKRLAEDKYRQVRALYAAPVAAQPQQAKPLSDAEIARIASTPCAVVGSYVHTFARAIEAAHGIKESP